MTMDTRAVLDRVRLSSRSVSLREPAFQTINALQDFDAALQIEALFLAGTVLCQHIGMDPHEMVSRMKRMLAETEHLPNQHLDAVRDYAGELK